MIPDPSRHKQINTNGGTGFIGGQHVHNHHYGSYPAGAAAAASRDATKRGVTVGPPVTEWGPIALGVHASITVYNETTPTPYLSRPHDQRLRDHLTQAQRCDHPTFVLVAGTSCTGKTRTLYEAVTSVLPGWPLTVPDDDSHLAQLLLDGIPAGTIVWLDELQDRIPTSFDGIIAAKAIRELLHADVGPILFCGTIWPTNLRTMQGRRDATQAASGASAIPKVVNEAKLIEVPECFLDREVAVASSMQDPRLLAALHTAATATHPRQGREVIQVLAGGTQLVQRLYPAEGILSANRFSPVASAVLRAASDLRRIGMPNPIPSWAIEGAAPGYLRPSSPRPPQEWLPSAMLEVTQAAEHDDPLTGNRTHDIHHDGVAALTPRWITAPNGTVTPAYDLHDYLSQDHMARARHEPTDGELWRVLEANSAALDRHTHFVLEQAAGARGLYSSAAHFARLASNSGDASAERRLAQWLSMQGGRFAVEELRTLAEAGSPDARDRLPWNLASRDISSNIDELYAMADPDAWPPITTEAEEIEELRVRVDGTTRGSDQAMADLLDCVELGEIWNAQRGASPRWQAFVNSMFPEPDHLERTFNYLTAEDVEDDSDDHAIRERLSFLLAQTITPETKRELRVRAMSGDGCARRWHDVVRRFNWEAGDRLFCLLSRHSQMTKYRVTRHNWRIALWDLHRRGDPESIESLCSFTEAGLYEARRVLVHAFVDEDHPRALDHSRALATLIKWEEQFSVHRKPNWWLAAEASSETESEAEGVLRERARSGDDPPAEIWMAWLLARQGLVSVIQATQAQIGSDGWWLEERIAACLSYAGTAASLDILRSKALGGDVGAASWLVTAYRRRQEHRWVVGLNVQGGPDYEE